MQRFTSRPSLALACLGTGVFVGLLCLAVSIVSALVAHEWGVSDPGELLLRLAAVFMGAGVVGAMPFVPFVLWLSARQVRLEVVAQWLIGATLAGAVVGEWFAPLVNINPYRLSVPGVLLGAGAGAAVAALYLARVSGHARESR